MKNVEAELKGLKEEVREGFKEIRNYMEESYEKSNDKFATKSQLLGSNIVVALVVGALSSMLTYIINHGR